MPEYKGVEIIIQWHADGKYHYRTSDGANGAGQRTWAEALADAKKAIDEKQGPGKHSG
ncbi:MAG: hypothetical protein ABIG63_16190 [Chloroflexota bacterium]